MEWKAYDYEATFNRRGDADYCYRPMLDIEVSNGAKSLSLGGLVDSGTDITMMDMEVFRALGINPDNCDKGGAFGAGADDKDAKPGLLAPVTVHIPSLGTSITSRVLFIKQLGFEVILGQDDFFRRVLVRFEQHKHKFYLKLAPTPDEKDT